jgi:hypothetical protein
MSRDPDERFETADDMRRKLQEWLQTSGPLVTEHDIARAVIDRVGKSIQERTERIQRVLRARPKVTLATDVTVSELTLVPTISAVAVASAVRSVLRMRLARAASFGAAAATILAAAWLLGGRPGERAGAIASAPSVAVQVGPATFDMASPAAPGSLPTAAERASAAPNVRSPAVTAPRESGRDTPRRKPVAAQTSRSAPASAPSTRAEAASASETARGAKAARAAEPRAATPAVRSPVRAAPHARSTPRTVRAASIGPLESDL